MVSMKQFTHTKKKLCEAIKGNRHRKKVNIEEKY